MQDSGERMRGAPHKRYRKNVIESDSEEEEAVDKNVSSGHLESLSHPTMTSEQGTVYSMDTDISQLEAPTFTTLDRGPSQPMLRLNWDHKLDLLGKKVVNPMIHCCDKCLKPILIYGRMIPCKHVFCLTCAQASEKAACSRCGDKVARVEQAGLGSIYMCAHGGSRYGNDGCRRTYLSQRDLHAHIQHRHMRPAAMAAAAAASSGGLAVPALPAGLPSAAAIAEAAAALVNARNKQGSSRTAVAATGASSTHYDLEFSKKQQPTTRPEFGSPPPSLRTGNCDYVGGGGANNFVNAQAAAAGGAPHKQVVPNVSPGGSLTSSSRQSNLITVAIHEQARNNGGGFSSSYYSRGGQQQQPQQNVVQGGRTSAGYGGGQFSQPPPSFYPPSNASPVATVQTGYQSFTSPNSQQQQNFEGSGNNNNNNQNNQQWSSRTSSGRSASAAAPRSMTAEPGYYNRR